MSDTFSKVEVITGVARRRRFSTDLKLAVVAETMQPGMSISYVARRHGLSPSLVFRWRQLMSEGGSEAVRADDEVVPAAEVRRLEERVRDLERLLGRKTWRSRSSRRRSTSHGQKKRSRCRALRPGRFPMKRSPTRSGVARSNIAERVKGAAEARTANPRRRSRAGAEIRRLVDARPTYGYRRIAALLKRERRSDGWPRSTPSASTG